MGAQQVLRAAACSVLIAGTAAAAPGLPLRVAAGKERAAVIDLGPTNPDVRRTLEAAVVAAGLELVQDDGVEDALAGIASDRDTLALAAAMADAEHAFGQLDCKATATATGVALPILAARQAAGIDVPELARAWTYLLLCADREGDTDAAMRAAARLRTVVRAGGSADVPAPVLAKYPEVDATSDAEPVEVDVTTEVANATVWVDFEPAGTAPLHLALPPGEHVIAAASGTRRGYVTGTPVASQPALAIAMPDQAGKWSRVARRVAGWHGKLPPPAELGWVLQRVHARAALVRHGDVVEVWGRAGLAEAPHRLGGEDGVRSLAEADRAAELLADRAEGWSSHAPDPDQPLLVEDIHARAARLAGHEEPTAWWVYATIGAAVLAGATVVYVHHAETSTQHLELHYP
jgi:hypothetical protein